MPDAGEALCAKGSAGVPGPSGPHTRVRWWERGVGSGLWLVNGPACIYEMIGLLIRQALFVNLARAEVSKPLDGLKLNGIGTLQ